MKKETTIFIRSIVTVLQTMDPLPDERYVTMRLYYNATCPERVHSFRKAEAVDLQYVRFDLATALAIWIEIDHVAYPHAPTAVHVPGWRMQLRSLCLP
jgi:hypothetical protein